MKWMMFASANFEYINTSRSTETTYCHDSASVALPMALYKYVYDYDYFDFWFLKYTETSILTSSNCRFDCTDDGPADRDWHYRLHCPTGNTIETDRILQMQKIHFNASNTVLLRF